MRHRGLEFESTGFQILGEEIEKSFDVELSETIGTMDAINYGDCRMPDAHAPK